MVMRDTVIFQPMHLIPLFFLLFFFLNQSCIVFSILSAVYITHPFVPWTSHSCHCDQLSSCRWRSWWLWGVNWTTLQRGVSYSKSAAPFKPHTPLISPSVWMLMWPFKAHIFSRQCPELQLIKNARVVNRTVPVLAKKKPANRMVDILLYL